MAENVKLPTGGARIGRATQKSTGLGVSPYGTYLLSFVTFGQAVLKIIIGNQLQIYDTKWPPGGARIDAWTLKIVSDRPLQVGNNCANFGYIPPSRFGEKPRKPIVNRRTDRRTDRRPANNMRPL